MRQRSYVAAVFLGVILTLGAGTSTGNNPDLVRADVGPVLITQIPRRAGGAGSRVRSAGASSQLPQGSRIVLFDPAVPGSAVRDLTSGFAAAGRADLSFDGTRMLFVARRAVDDALNVWEMELQGGATRQITHTEQDHVQAIYLSTLYTLDAVAPEPRIAYCIDDGRAPETGVACAALYTCRMDGSDSRKITFNPYGVGDPYLLVDGRLLYVSARPPESGGGTALFTIHPDGTDVSVFAAAHEPPALRGMPVETTDDDVVYVESNTAGALDGGSLIAVSRSRSLHGRRLLADDGDGSYRSPSALPGGKILVSYRRSESETYGIHVLDPRHPDRHFELFDAQDRHDLDALAVRSRKRPAGRSSVVDERSAHGFLYCMDSYLSDRKEAREIAPGGIATLRVFEHSATGELVAELPVRSDGSFYIQLPARVPLRLETVDTAGVSLQAMENWIWVMPNEQRGCIGCHEDRERTPPNRHPLALRAQPLSVVPGDPAGNPAAGEHRE